MGSYKADIKACIVIPVYKGELSHNEEISLQQCLRILNQYDTYVIYPEGVKVDFGDKIKCIKVKSKYMASRRSYSDYVLSSEFYDTFKAYDYMLLYQLDAFVFEDRLMEFCDLKYDYIGAPWIYGMECHVLGKQLLYVGNGGFSLRRIEAFRQWIHGHSCDVANEKMFLMEDQVIASYGSRYLNIAPVETALKFAFNLNPVECYERNDKNLPFGCHGWYKFEKEFWKKQIETLGYTVEETQDSIYADGIDWSEGFKRADMLNKYFKKERIDQGLRELIKNYSGTVSVFGAGTCGLSFANMIKGTEVKIDTFFDNDMNKVGKQIEGYSIKSSTLIKNDGNTAILIALLRPKPIVSQLEAFGLRQGIDFAVSKQLQYKLIELAGT